ncbi:MAG TPA: hypothetical protein VJ966_06795 [Actinomycetes bacterium]|nr:hypothetical protein [Actinomycetes bacterium]
MTPQKFDETERPAAAEDIRSRMRRGLVAAMKARDQQAVAALRTTLAAIDNAEAIENDEVVYDEEIDEYVADPRSALDAVEAHPAVAGSVLGVGAAEANRRILTPAEVAEVVHAEVTEREAAAELLERVGPLVQAERLRDQPERRHDQAERLRAQIEHLRAEAKLLRSYLDPPGPSPAGAGPAHPSPADPPAG